MFNVFRTSCLQGGGVYVQSGSVTFSSCTITGNSATFVRAHAQKFPSPRWEKGLTCLPRLSLAQLRPTLWGQLQIVRAAETKTLFPWPQWEKALLTCPFRFSSFMMDAASNYQFRVRASAPETSKVPIAPIGFSHVCARLCLQGGGVAVSGGTVSFSSCTITGNTASGVRAHAQNFPSLKISLIGRWLTCPNRLSSFVLD